MKTIIQAGFADFERIFWRFTRFTFLAALFGLGRNASGALAQGSLGFIGLNTSGNLDFAIVAFQDIAPGEVVYFRDDEPQNSQQFNGSDEGTLAWTTNSTVRAGSVVVFSALDSPANPGFGVTTGSLQTVHNTLNLQTAPFSGDAIYVYQTAGTYSDPVTSWIASIAQGRYGGSDGAGNLGPTGLTLGKTAIEVDFNGSEYSGPRTGFPSYSDYQSLIGAYPDNWEVATFAGIEPANNTTRPNADGSAILPFDTTPFLVQTPELSTSTFGIFCVAGLLFYRKRQLLRI